MVFLDILKSALLRPQRYGHTRALKKYGFHDRSKTSGRSDYIIQISLIQNFTIERCGRNPQNCMNSVMDEGTGSGAYA